MLDLLARCFLSMIVQSSGGGRDALSDRAAMDTNVAPASGPLSAYRAMVAGGGLAPDPSQQYAASRLQTLWDALRGYDPAALRRNSGGGLLDRLLRRRTPTPLAPEGTPKGLYLVGEVGRGKSMLMDLFFAAAAEPKPRRHT